MRNNVQIGTICVMLCLCRTLCDFSTDRNINNNTDRNTSLRQVVTFETMISGFKRLNVISRSIPWSNRELHACFTRKSRVLPLRFVSTQCVRTFPTPVMEAIKSTGFRLLQQNHLSLCIYTGGHSSYHRYFSINAGDLRSIIALLIGTSN